MHQLETSLYLFSDIFFMLERAGLEAELLEDELGLKC